MRAPDRHKGCFTSRPAFTSPGYDTFAIDRISISEEQEELLFEFCRTQLLPYDAVVELCLNLLKEYFPEVDILKPD